MGLCTSECPNCSASIDWFPKPPSEYVCKCGETISEADLINSWNMRYSKHMMNTIISRISKSPVTEESKSKSLNIINDHIKAATRSRLSWKDVNLFFNRVIYSVLTGRKSYYDSIIEHSLLKGERDE